MNLWPGGASLYSAVYLWVADPGVRPQHRFVASTICWASSSEDLTGANVTQLDRPVADVADLWPIWQSKLNGVADPSRLQRKGQLMPPQPNEELITPLAQADRVPWPHVQVPIGRRHMAGWKRMHEDIRHRSSLSRFWDASQVRMETCTLMKAKGSSFHCPSDQVFRDRLVLSMEAPPSMTHQNNFCIVQTLITPKTQKEDIWGNTPFSDHSLCSPFSPFSVSGGC